MPRQPARQTTLGPSRASLSLSESIRRRGDRDCGWLEDQSYLSSSAKRDSPADREAWKRPAPCWSVRSTMGEYAYDFTRRERARRAPRAIRTIRARMTGGSSGGSRQR